MVQMANVSSAKSTFAKLPVTVAAKTGTAEKSGKIPTDNEVDYLKSHMSSYNVSLEEATKLAEKLKAEREQELSKEKEKEIKEELKTNKDLTEKEKTELEEQLKEGIKVKLENTDKVNSSYLRKAIKELNPSITDDKIDAFKSDYRPFAWSVAFAPANDPQIAVAVMIPQGSTSSYALLVAREVIGTYFDLGNSDVEIGIVNEEDIQNSTVNKKENINFTSQMKN